MCAAESSPDFQPQNSPDSLPTPPEGEAASPSAEVHLRMQVEVPAHTTLHLTIESRSPEGKRLESHTLTFANPPLPLPDWLEAPTGEVQPHPSRWERTTAHLPSFLLGLALLVYLATRLIALPDFPVYFFTDEAVQTVLAADLVRDGFRGYNGEFLPAYFPNGSMYNLSLSVYVQVLPYLWFGKSVWVTRAVPAVISLLAALSVGLLLRRGFGSPFGWGAALLLAVMPAWFLHSRTAFEVGLAVTFFAVFLYAYWRYREGQPAWIYGAVCAAALTFYSYSPAQMVIISLSLFLLISDWHYHWQQRRRLLLALGLVAMFALPYLRFQIEHPGEMTRHLTLLNSYWLSDRTPLQKVGIYLSEYVSGLNPLYWFIPQTGELIRHVMKGYGHLGWISLPFVTVGLGRTLQNLRRSEYRLILLALLAAPSGAALVKLGITRALFMVIPAALLGGLGLESVIHWLSRRLQKRWPRPNWTVWLSLVLFLLLTIAAFSMLQDALNHAPFWSSDYGLSGLQWGARQLFAEVSDYLSQNPGVDLVVSPSWANGTDVIARFFFDDPLPFRLGSIEGYLNDYQPLAENTRFVMIPEEWQKVQESNKFTDVQVERRLNYPNGKTGFYFVRLRYVENAQDLFEQERQERRALQEKALRLNDGTLLNVRYSRLDMGEIEHAFDGQPGTLIRTLEANPLVLNLFFDTPQSLKALTTRIGGVPGRVVVWVYPPDGQNPRRFEAEKEETPDPREVTVLFDTELTASQIDIEIYSTRDGESAHVHLWDVRWQ
ncbi:4-amino-4-deoxy-L-arabinose transferase [Bellilinea caldifistulae]|uniref:ArnT family glycosyltransferase n=1 Tax=Bellilinea caldifistulae TaxID=360411 RepID=UPI000785DC8A|nr:glycosyltransferase family 39 protein [Bellilinea caldifistulae]GAP09260.1 4-amino-4-deoxy-L-arabinose transferase [Bellilinea caldifistulae]